MLDAYYKLKYWNTSYNVHDITKKQIKPFFIFPIKGFGNTDKRQKFKPSNNIISFREELNQLKVNEEKSYFKLWVETHKIEDTTLKRIINEYVFYSLLFLSQ